METRRAPYRTRRIATRSWASAPPSQGRQYSDSSRQQSCKGCAQSTVYSLPSFWGGGYTHIYLVISISSRTSPSVDIASSAMSMPPSRQAMQWQSQPPRAPTHRAHRRDPESATWEQLNEPCSQKQRRTRRGREPVAAPDRGSSEGVVVSTFTKVLSFSSRTAAGGGGGDEGGDGGADGGRPP